MKPLLLPLLLTGLAALLSGCATYNYNLAAKNSGNQEVWCSSVASSKGVAHAPGRLTPGATATIAGPFTLPYADKWTVAWKTAKGEQFEKTLNLIGKLPKHFQGRLVFIIDADNNLGYVEESFDGK